MGTSWSKKEAGMYTTQLVKILQEKKRMEFFKNLISLAILNRNENDFLEEGKFGLNALLTDLEIPNRPGIIARPPFPKEFTVSNFGLLQELKGINLKQSLKE